MPPRTAAELVELLAWFGVEARAANAVVRCAGDRPELVGTLAFVHGWTVDPVPDGTDLLLHRSSP